MRVSAYIVAWYIGFLTVQPSLGFLRPLETLEFEERCSTSCCASSCEVEQSDPTQNCAENDCCPNGICNPLLNCYCCMGVTMKQSISVFIGVSVLHTTGSSFPGQILTSYIADCFNPPEFV